MRDEPRSRNSQVSWTAVPDSGLRNFNLEAKTKSPRRTGQCHNAQVCESCSCTGMESNCIEVCPSIKRKTTNGQRMFGFVSKNKKKCLLQSCVWQSCVWESCVWQCCMWKSCLLQSCVWQSCAWQSCAWESCLWQSCAFGVNECVALTALGCHNFVTHTHNRRGTYGTGLALAVRLVARGRLWRRGLLRGRRGTWWHQRRFCVAGAKLRLEFLREVKRR